MRVYAFIGQSETDGLEAEAIARHEIVRAYERVREEGATRPLATTTNTGSTAGYSSAGNTGWDAAEPDVALSPLTRWIQAGLISWLLIFSVAYVIWGGLR